MAMLEFGLTKVRSKVYSTVTAWLWCQSGIKMAL
jgi:hypothetical protein